MDCRVKPGNDAEYASELTVSGYFAVNIPARNPVRSSVT